jgi:hypothetical protein
VVALHNAAYDEAADHFRSAQKIDPTFVMAYWGEAMTYNHPFWAEQNISGGRAALARLAPSRAARAAKARTAREREYLAAVELLYGEGAKLKPILQKQPDHPGALHYFIHANDDSEHARLALDAARKYEKIGGSSFYALHMPSHIYMQLGMWADVVRANQAAFDVSDRNMRARGLSVESATITASNG